MAASAIRVKAPQRLLTERDTAVKRVWLSGAGGFIGHHVLEHLLATTDWDVVATDSFRHRGTTDRIMQVLAPCPQWRRRLKVITHDLTAPFTPMTIASMGKIDYMIAMASESHVDRSIADPVPFVRNNVAVTTTTLELARELKPQSVIVISTDEVYGPVRPGEPNPPEWSPILPSSPYAASKAAQEAIAFAWWRTYGVPVTIVNCMNLFGERQDGEKMLPMLIRKISRGQEVALHGTTGNIGSRYYLHARNLADALVFLLNTDPPMPAQGRPDRYNVVGLEQVSNLELAERVATIVGSSLWYRLVDFASARPGHDPHYGLDGAKLAATGWKPPVPFAESLERTVRWSMLHPEWLE